jgi:hypothetical protein
MTGAAILTTCLRVRRIDALRLTAADAVLRAELDHVFRDHDAAFFGCLTPTESEAFAASSRIADAQRTRFTDRTLEKERNFRGG